MASGKTAPQAETLQNGAKEPGTGLWGTGAARSGDSTFKSPVVFRRHLAHSRHGPYGVSVVSDGPEMQPGARIREGITVRVCAPSKMRDPPSEAPEQGTDFPTLDTKGSLWLLGARGQERRQRARLGNGENSKQVPNGWHLSGPGTGHHHRSHRSGCCRHGAWEGPRGSASAEPVWGNPRSVALIHPPGARHFHKTSFPH